MRILGLAAVLVALSSPAGAQQSLGDQFDAANRIFMGGLPTPALAEGPYFDAVTANLQGGWIDATVLELGAMDSSKRAETIEKSCGFISTGYAVSAPFTLTATLVNRQFTVLTDYVYIGGTSFSAQVDAAQQLTRLGIINQLDKQGRTAIFALQGASGLVDLYRPSPDVLVITSSRMPARIMMRCSSTSPVPTGGEDATATMKAALYKVFDEQLGSQADPAKREAFVTCASSAFGAVSAADLQTLIATGFNPGVDEQKRLDAAYPGLQSKARACADAAQSAPTP